MARTLLKIVQATTGELGFIQPTQVLASQELTITQLKQLVIAACDELLDVFNWQRLLKRCTITTTDGVSLYALPADYHRMVPQSQWNSSNTSPAYGSVGPAVWEGLTIRNVGTANTQFRLVGNQIEVFPTPGAGEVITFAYISNHYVIDGTNGLPKAEFSLDSDTTVFHDRLLTNFVKLKLLQVKKLNTMAAVEDYNASLEAAQGSDTPAPLLCTDPWGSTAGYADHELYDLMVTQ